ncbi:GNAT family N-acetyltransferase [Amycolatopsis acidicola]|uniref:GNAT family N-acetyltransferase n=1 Tax=Amycolatopsis acidicola TaxID=2596893 RepID=UPI00140DBDDC
MTVVRRLSPDDWPRWRTLRLAALADSPESFGTPLSYWEGHDRAERWRQRLTEVPFNAIADLDGERAGMVSCVGPDEHGDAELLSLWVAPFARGRGVGDALVGAVAQWAEQQRARRLVLRVLVGNLSARALYQRNGFADAGPADVGERWMTRRVHAGWSPGAPGVLRLPSGRLVRGRGLRRPLPKGPRPEFALYLLKREPPPVEWESRWVRWPDFGLPSDRAAASDAFREALSRAETQRVEIACLGGRGRTGTALACLTVLDGVPGAEAVRYVRERYAARAVETVWQRRFVARFG